MRAVKPYITNKEYVLRRRRNMIITIIGILLFIILIIFYNQIKNTAFNIFIKDRIDDKEHLVDIVLLERKINTELKSRGLNDVQGQVNDNLIANLKGTVGETRHKVLASKIAESFKEIRGVRNDIIVKTTPPTPPPPQPMTKIVSRKTELRSSHYQHAPSIGSINQGDQVTLLERWFIDNPNALIVISPTELMLTTGPISLYAGAIVYIAADLGSEYKVAYKIGAREVTGDIPKEFVSEIGNQIWYKIKTQDSKEGWVYSDYIKYDETY